MYVSYLIYNFELYTGRKRRRNRTGWWPWKVVLCGHHWEGIRWKEWILID